MAEASDAQGILCQNLMDAGCDRETARQCILLSQRKNIPALLRLLSRHRQALLDAVHLNQKRLDCLDYLIYRTEQERQTEE